MLARERAVEIDHGGVRGRVGLAETADRYWGEIRRAVRRPRALHRRRPARRSSWSGPKRRSATESRATLRSDPETWHLTIELEVYDGDERIAERRWERTTPRDLQ